MQRWEASGGTAPVTGRRRQKSAGRPADHGSLTTCRQALGGRDIGEEDRESAQTGRGRQEGRPHWSWLDLQLRSRRLSQESRWPRRPAPVAGRREVFTVCWWLGASPSVLTSILACDCHLPRGSCPRCAPSHRGCFLWPFWRFRIASSRDRHSSPLRPYPPPRGASHFRRKTSIIILFHLGYPHRLCS